MAEERYKPMSNGRFFDTHTKKVIKRLPNVKYQRVSYKDALIMLEKELNNKPAASTYVYDHAGGSDEFIEVDFFKEFLKKITR